MLFCLMNLLAFGQNQMENYFYADGKIRVVIAVLVIIFTLIVVYLIRLDRKVKKLEDHED